MPTRHSPTHDVLIVGAGPVGLFLACELQLAGLAVRVLEKSGPEASRLKRFPFGLRGLSSASMDALQRRGLRDPLMKASASRDAASTHWANQPRSPAGHFAGIQFYCERVDHSAWPNRADGSAGPHTMVEMAQLEATLAAHARSLGVDIHYNLAVDNLTQTDTQVCVQAGELNRPEFSGGSWV